MNDTAELDTLNGINSMPIRAIVKAYLLYAFASFVWLLLHMFEPMILGGYILGVLIGSGILASKMPRPVISISISILIISPLVLGRILLLPAVGGPEEFASYKNAMHLLSIGYHCLIGWLIWFYVNSKYK